MDKRAKHSALATIVAEVATLPICTIKTNFQTTKVTEQTIFQTARKIYRSSGIIGFYNASLWAISSQVLSTSSKYVLYRSLQDYFKLFCIDSSSTSQSPSLIKNACIGGISGALSSLLTHPFDFFKINTQTKSPILPCLQKEGISIIYRGYSKTISKAILGGSLWFPLFDTYKYYFPQTILASAATALTSTLLLHPIDYLKTRQIHGEPIRYTLKIWSYYKGLSIHLLRVVPHFIITMKVIEWLEEDEINSKKVEEKRLPK